MISDPTPTGDIYKKATEDILRPMDRLTPSWFIGLAISLACLGIGAISWAIQLRLGMGMTGLNNPIGWAIYITNFVWWIGIAHSGTLISAFLYLFRAPFRAAFSRCSEAMTLIAVTTAGLFPLIHVGRPWRAYWLLPYPNERMLWINFRSPLILDVFAVSTYFTVSAIFFWLGTVPDVAVMRDRVRGWKRTVYGLLSLGWEGTQRQWKPYLMAYSLLACLAAPLVVSVHSVVSWDFAAGIVPGWHSTISAPFFVAGAILSGLAMVFTLMLPIRAWFHLEDYITLERLDQLAKLTLLMGMVVTYSYLMEYFVAWYGGEATEQINLLNKAFGAYATEFWIMTFCNCIAPLFLFFRTMRRNVTALFIIAAFINVGMWMERFVIVACSLARDYNPYAWNPIGYQVTLTELGITLGSVGWFMTLFLLFCKFLPVLPIAEVKRDILLEEREEHAIHEAHAHRLASGGLDPREVAG